MKSRIVKKMMKKKKHRRKKKGEKPEVFPFAAFYGVKISELEELSRGDKKIKTIGK